MGVGVHGRTFFVVVLGIVGIMARRAAYIGRTDGAFIRRTGIVVESDVVFLDRPGHVHGTNDDLLPNLFFCFSLPSPFAILHGLW